MKRIICFAILGLLTFTGCKKEPSLAELLCGEWRGSELAADAGIYVGFAADGTFELYQKLESEGFELRRGRWTLAGDLLSGTYNDGEPWAASYKASVNGDKLTLVSQEEGSETGIYSKCTIPDGIRTGCTVVVKSRSRF